MNSDEIDLKNKAEQGRTCSGAHFWQLMKTPRQAPAISREFALVDHTSRYHGTLKIYIGENGRP